MAGSFSDYLELKILDHVFGKTAYTAPATVYIGLWTTAGSLTDASDGTAATEVTGGGYARVAVTNNTTNWPNAASGSKSSGAAFDFGTASGNLGTINQMAVLDASSGGNILAWADLTAAKTVNSGDTYKFNSGDLTITLT